jgi:hypothetical protein
MVLQTGFIKHGKKQNQEKMDFVPLNYPWTVHPERNQTWRDEQDKEIRSKNGSTGM